VKSLGTPLKYGGGAGGSRDGNFQSPEEHEKPRSTVVLTCHHGTSSLILEATPFAVLDTYGVRI
jgi:hypothetical protein